MNPNCPTSSSDEFCRGGNRSEVVPTAVLGVFEGENQLGDTQAVPNCRENMCGTPGTVADYYFRFAAATVEKSKGSGLASDWSSPSKYTRRQLFHENGVHSEWFQVDGAGVSMKPS